MHRIRALSNYGIFSLTRQSITTCISIAENNRKYSRCDSCSLRARDAVWQATPLLPGAEEEATSRGRSNGILNDSSI